MSRMYRGGRPTNNYPSAYLYAGKQYHFKWRVPVASCVSTEINGNETDFLKFGMVTIQKLKESLNES